jgi:hypothetical protein
MPFDMVDVGGWCRTSDRQAIPAQRFLGDDHCTQALPQGGVIPTPDVRVRPGLLPRAGMRSAVAFLDKGWASWLGACLHLPAGLAQDFRLADEHLRRYFVGGRGDLDRPQLALGDSGHGYFDRAA